MKLIICLTCVIGVVVLSRPADPNTVQILRYENAPEADGGYHFTYETSDGSTREERGHVINAGTENEAVAVEGSFTYTGPDNVQYTVHYVADENGFQPRGAHIPEAGAAQLPKKDAGGIKLRTLAGLNDLLG